MSSVFKLHTGYEPRFGLSLENSHLSNFGQTVALSSNLKQFKIQVQLSETNAIAPFYTATVQLEKNSGFTGEWSPNLGAFVAGLEPMPYAWPHSNDQCSAVYHNGRSTRPLADGRLLPGTYRIRVTVVDPIPLTNPVCFWVKLQKPETFFSRLCQRTAESVESMKE